LSCARFARSVSAWIKALPAHRRYVPEGRLVRDEMDVDMAMKGLIKASGSCGKYPCGIIKGSFGRLSLNALSRPLALHAHSEFNILVKLAGSNCEFRSQGDRLQVQDSVALLFNPWQPHCKLLNKDEPTLFLSLLIDPNWMQMRYDLPARNSDRLFTRTSVCVSRDVFHLAIQIAGAITSHEAGGGRFECLVSKLVAAVMASHGPANDNSARRRPTDARIFKAMRLLRSQPFANTNLRDIAREVGLSRSRFFQQFSNCVGTSPQQYIDWLRVAATIEQLLGSKLPVGRIASDLGFGEHTHFTRFFVQHIGMTPSEFRRVALVVE
jgi:AraC family transcriptional regulator